MNFITVHFDDSGTHPEASTAIAACYVSTAEQWTELTRNWNEVRAKENFDVFHMVDFAAGQKDFAGWDDAKKERVLTKLCSIINTRIMAAYAVAVPKNIYDYVIKPESPFRGFCGYFHYTFAVRQCASRVGKWRAEHHKSKSMRYIFDQMAKKSGKGEIMRVMDSAIETSVVEAKVTGVEPLSGYSFESKRVILPLQAADIFAWTVFQQMQKRLAGRTLEPIADLAWGLVGACNVPFEASFFTREQLIEWAELYLDSLSQKLKETSNRD